jgi:hypothetical protein
VHRVFWALRGLVRPALIRKITARPTPEPQYPRTPWGSTAGPRFQPAAPTKRREWSASFAGPGSGIAPARPGRRLNFMSRRILPSRQRYTSSLSEGPGTRGFNNSYAKPLRRKVILPPFPDIVQTAAIRLLPLTNRQIPYGEFLPCPVFCSCDPCSAERPAWIEIEPSQDLKKRRH